MKIDFTEFESPIDGLSLSDWKPDARVDVSPEDAEAAGLGDELAPCEFIFEAEQVDIRFTPEHEIQFGKCSVAAGIRPDNSLLSFRIRSMPLPADEIYELAGPVIKAWGLHAFDVAEMDSDEHDRPLTQLDALVELENWRRDPATTLPSYLAQADPSPYPGIWILRVVINRDFEDETLFVLSIQCFWRDRAFDDDDSDKTFWERADAVINLANDQASEAGIRRVAVSLTYAAARYNSFDYWTHFDSAVEFQSERKKAIDLLVSQFREMLEDNFDDHLEQFD